MLRSRILNFFIWAFYVKKSFIYNVLNYYLILRKFLPKKRNLIITGVLPINASGTGDFLIYLKYNKDFDIALRPFPFIDWLKSLIRIILSKDFKSTKNIISSTIIYFMEIFPIVNNFPFKKNIYSKIILFHPQSLSYEFVNSIVPKKIINGIYILDNSSFCYASYNWHFKDPFSPCKLCLEDSNYALDNNCKDYFNNNFNDYLAFKRNLLLGNFGEIIVQNHSHQKLWSLLSKGKESKIAGPIAESIFIERSNTRSKYIRKIYFQNRLKFKYNVICHMRFSGAKGYYLAREIASILKEFLFIFPFDNPSKDNQLDKSNLLFLPCSWDTGLRDICKESDMILIPSIWLVSVEGSLIKSCQVGKRVAAFEESIFDKKDYLKGVHYLKKENGIVGYSDAIRGILSQKSNEKVLKNSAKKYITMTKRNLDAIMDY